MKIVAQFNPLLTASLTGSTPSLAGTFDAQLRPGQGKIAVYNQSIANLNFSFDNNRDIEFVGAQSYRVFFLNVSTWKVAWSLVNFTTQNGAAQTYPTPLNQHFSPGGLVTVVSYDTDEEIPQIGTLSSYLNPWDYDKLISTIEGSVTFTVGANGTVFTLSIPTVGTAQMAYIAGVYIKLNQTSSSSNHVELEFSLTSGTILGHYLVNNNFTQPLVDNMTFSPSFMETSIGNNTNLSVKCVASNIAGAGADRTCSCMVSWYLV